MAVSSTSATPRRASWKHTRSPDSISFAASTLSASNSSVPLASRCIRQMSNYLLVALITFDRLSCVTRVYLLRL
ncbi:hypothetical protein SCHPADRAFT_275620 [Schizopora paradoxa]|uniref:Uncharacterized protein n=1 Tax=Schizopora paradoxa TaxID=27342 RepID=A0A0H2RT17_9AGAM|nr:hypothetical protein SCHPADRAFT_275620 [Schizopora paradoxa]